MACLLGVDIGTSGAKTVLFDESGRALSSASAEYLLYQPKGGWAEQEPMDWWRAVCGSIRAVLAKSGVPPADIAGVGLSGQMHGVVPLDGGGQVLRRAIIWCDQRSGPQCAEITARVGRERLIAITANPALTGFSAGKILWIREHEPEIFDQIRHILLPKDYIRLCLTGEYATEVSDCSGTQLLDVPRRRYSGEILQKLALDPALFPPVHESVEVTGRVSAAGAAATGLAVGTPVVGGAGDQAAGGIGNGIVRPGLVSSTIGTSGVLFVHSDTVTIDPLGRTQTFCHAVPGAWHVMGVTQAAGLSLQWFRNQFCAAECETARQLGLDSYVLLDREAANVPAGCGGLYYLPYLMGERAPHLDPEARGVFFGLDPTHSRSHLLRAVMEGVAYSLRDCFGILRDLGADLSQVRASGGGGKSPLWRQMQADMFHAPVFTLENTEGPALGVALLAGVAAGIYRDVPEACGAVLRIAGQQEPEPAAAAVYNAGYPVYQALYQALKPVYRQTAELGL